MNARATFGLLLAIALTASCSRSASERSDASTDARAPDASVDAQAPIADAGASSSDALAPPADAMNLPASTSDDLTARMRHLLEAISRDDASLGVDMLFPRDAWVASHDQTDPGKFWDNKISNGFHRSVHTLHKRTKGVERAQFVSFELGHAVVEITPKRKDWQLPLWRVHRSRLTFDLDGRPHTFEIAEIVSWRGAWYVTKLR